MKSEPVVPVAAPTRPVFARHASSLLVVRQGSSGPEVLMGVRGAGHRFMPNRLVFPGGAVDRVDRTSPAATEPNPDLLAALARNARPPLARAIAMAAARELQEETGLTLGVPARLDGLDYLCRAVTPPESPVRFNARFLIASAERLEGSVADTHELQDVGFRPLSTLDRSVLVLVTREVLDRLDTWLSLSAAQRSDRRVHDVFHRRRWRTE